jgi:ABC-type phosphate/phosphonate transport system substrate-binding protein
MIRSMRTCALAIGLLLATAVCAADPFVLVVMDPLSKPLSCDCVRGYAQRDYQLLASHLERSLGAEVKVLWFESLAAALDETGGRADLVIGKHSVVVADMKATGHGLRPIAQLTGKDGDVNQKGLVVVRGDDSATMLSELRGYRVLFGPVDAEEKSSAAEAALVTAGVDLPDKRERHGACSEAATALLDMPPDVNVAAVISSYAEPLLEGCGSIKKGDLRVVGETKPVPFVTAFVSAELNPAMQEQVLLSLVTAGTKPELLTGLETLAGFVPWNEPSDAAADVKKKILATAGR